MCRARRSIPAFGACWFPRRNQRGELVPGQQFLYTSGMKNLDDLFVGLEASGFRRKQVLSEKDRGYLQTRGLDTVLAHGADFIEKRLAPAAPLNDGKQTPWRGHPIFTAQHATATCCRGCLAKWHGIAKGHPLTQEQQSYILRVLERWLSHYIDEQSQQESPFAS